MENAESTVERRGGGDRRRPNALAGELLPEAPRQERSRRAHEALIAAALSRFAETGYEATSIDDIATQAGVAVGAFYLHFRSKRQVLLVLLDRLLREFDSWPALAPDAGAPTVIERIGRYFDQEWTFGGVYRAWREAALRDASLAHLDARLEAWTTARAVTLLEHAAAHPGVRPSADIPTLAGMLSVMFWRSLNASVDARKNLSTSISAVVTHALFEDAAGVEVR